MLELTLLRGSVRRVLALGAHADDIEIGCGGTLLALIRSTPGIEVTWVVFAASEGREREAQASAAAFLTGATDADVIVHGFRDGFLPHVGGEVKDTFEALKARVDPDLVLTHTKDDMHQDHRFVWELTWNTFRDHLVLEYEIPKYDGDLGRPNAYVPLTAADVAEKIELLERYYPSQAGKPWFDAETFRGLMRLRGVEANAPERFAEAFTARKLRVAL
jgi:LmbE family N-acetylglucosaminyl deacetylase